MNGNWSSLNMQSRISSCLVIASLGLVPAAAPAAHRPVRRSVAAKAANGNADPAAILAAQILNNSLNPGQDIWSACTRSNFAGLAAALDGERGILNPEKGEYETQADYSARIAHIRSVIAGTGNQFVCIKLGDPNYTASFKYNADLEQFDGNINNKLQVDEFYKSMPSYRSKTTMGIAATVSASVSVDYEMAISELEQFPPPCVSEWSEYSGAKMSFKDSISLAPGDKAIDYIVFIGSIVPPYIVTTDDPGSPTITDPSDDFVRHMTVQFRPTRIVVAGPGRDLLDCSR